MFRQRVSILVVRIRNDLNNEMQAAHALWIVGLLSIEAIPANIYVVRHQQNNKRKCCSIMVYIVIHKLAEFLK